MKKIILILLIIKSVYAVPPCEHPLQKVCIYLYNVGLIAEINIINMTDKRVSIDTTAWLDEKSWSYKNWILEPNQNINLLKSRYTDHLKKPYYGWKDFTYKFIE